MATRAAGDAVEADPELLLESVLAAGRQALAAARAPAAAVALANQGETVLAWDRRTGQPLTPAVVWQDRRSAGVCARLSAGGGLAGRGHRAAAGPVLRRAQDDLAAREPDRATAWSPPPTAWLLARLGAGYVTDASTASRTMLLDLDAADWSPRACAAFGIDPAALPAVADCAGIAGETAGVRPGAAGGRAGRGPAGGAWPRRAA